MVGNEGKCPTYEVMRKWADDGCPGFSYELWLEAQQEKERALSQRGKYERKKDK